MNRFPKTFGRSQNQLGVPFKLKYIPRTDFQFSITSNERGHDFGREMDT